MKHTEPKKILLSPEDIDRISNENKNKNDIKNVFLFFLGVIVPASLDFITFFNGKWEHYNTVYTTVLIIIAIVTIVFGVLTCKLKGRSVAEQIKKKAEDDSEYTAIFIISRIVTDNQGREQIKILVQNKTNWKCDLLPYVDINKEISLKNQEKYLLEELSRKLEVRSKDVEISHIKDGGCYSIKLSVPEQTEKLFKHEFYNVVLKNHIQEDVFKKFKWVDIDTLSNDINVMRINGDVIDNINRLKSSIVDSFVVNNLNKKSIKIIWNITKKCDFNCNICATGLCKEKELNLPEKYQALFSILSIKDSIREINFAGGDPLIDSDSVNIISNAISVLEENKISITTTGKGIEHLNDSERLQLLKSCSLTIDLSSAEHSDIRKTSDYNQINYRAIKKYRHFISKLRINMPILNTNISTKNIDSIIEKVNELEPDELSLIKLMPVGKQSYDLYPNNYNVKKVIEQLKNGIIADIRMHCALRCDLCDSGDNCTMLKNKLGVDCSGNVFACCWAGYLDCDLNENPFYLGNLLERNLSEIISGDNAFDLNEKAQRDNCNIFEFRKNGNHLKNSSYLYDKEVQI